MKKSSIRVNSVFKDNDISYKQIMCEILQNEVLINSILEQENFNLKVVNSCQTKDTKER